MRKTLYIVLIGFLLGFGSAGLTAGQASAADAAPQIKDILGEKTLLMEDGSMWSMINGNRVIRTPGNVEAVNGTELEGMGVTQDGKLIQWDIANAPHVVKDQTGVKQAAGEYWLKMDGTVWSIGGKVKKLEGIKLIGYGDRDFAALSHNGDVLIRDSYAQETYKKLGTIPDAASVKDISVFDSRVALLYDSGKVVIYETFNFDDNGKIIPVAVAEDAVHIAYGTGDPTPRLLVTRKDGTVWTTGNYQDRFKLAKQVPGLSDIVRTAVKEESHDQFYAQKSSGSWVMFDDGDIKPVDVPAIKKLDVSLSDAKPFVGDQLKIDIQETYTNGAKIKVPASEASIEIQKPHLLQLQSKGTVKVLGVGETKVTVTSGGISKDLTVSASLRHNLKYSKQAQGIVFVPAKPVFQALGGTVSPSGGGLDVKLGDTSLWFKAGTAQATLNGNKIRLKAVPMNDKEGTLIPVSLLSDALGAQARWDGKWKQAEISFGEARLTVVSAETASLIKKAAQGSLAKFIGRTYWINDFQGWERFSKVTVTDILPDDTGSFVIVFRSAAGKTLKSYSMSSSNVSQLFADESSFYKFDPYKKYKWSSSTWKKIKAGQVSLGMTKAQVQMSWGSPGSKSLTAVNGHTIETWVYGNFDTISFVNGKVFLIYA
ncbi:copper amine oxidase N-terminal domain-containing protein [Paenibacillus sp. DMB20]|uniref:copper amine oxidase N-terminal domain-containing protein n=1 Tax=Paenibacillus sp. DMB20 TaxID=1642570 RepID=UPI0006276487|nr:copper amine oxidase N-terminal domain-containing protein [Paenibacillus sp. DMB20]KKO53800.1 copper amine oxidase [Paenibacillus sp. DMB20]